MALSCNHCVPLRSIVRDEERSRAPAQHHQRDSKPRWRWRWRCQEARTKDVSKMRRNSVLPPTRATQRQRIHQSKFDELIAVIITQAGENNKTAQIISSPSSHPWSPYVVV